MAQDHQLDYQETVWPETPVQEGLEPSHRTGSTTASQNFIVGREVEAEMVRLRSQTARVLSPVLSPVCDFG